MNNEENIKEVNKPQIYDVRQTCPHWIPANHSQQSLEMILSSNSIVEKTIRACKEWEPPTRKQINEGIKDLECF